MDAIGKFIVGIGGVLIVIGLCIWLFGDRLGWVGNLPGDIRIERPGFSFYMTLSMSLSFDEEYS